jgi:hypothetical protein
LSTYSKLSIEEYIKYIVKQNNNYDIYNIQTVNKILIKLSATINNTNFDSWFTNWQDMPIPPSPLKKMKYEECKQRHLPILKKCLNIMIELFLENPNYFVNPYQLLCGLLLDELDIVTSKKQINKDKIGELKQLYKNLNNL